MSTFKLWYNNGSLDQSFYAIILIKNGVSTSSVSLNPCKIFKKTEIFLRKFVKEILIDFVWCPISVVSVTLCYKSYTFFRISRVLLLPRYRCKY
jgi:hypothetical protein